MPPQAPAYAPNEPPPPYSAVSFLQTLDWINICEIQIFVVFPVPIY